MRRCPSIALALASAAVLAAPAAAQDCSRPATLAAALADPHACALRQRPAVSRERKKTDEQPGVYRNGNTTISIGGSITSDTRIRAR